MPGHRRGQRADRHHRPRPRSRLSDADPRRDPAGRPRRGGRLASDPQARHHGQHSARRRPPRRRALRHARAGQPRLGCPHGPAQPQPGRRRRERDRHRALRRTGPDPHPRTGSVGPLLRTGRPLFHDRRRLRLLQVGRGVVSQLGPRGRARRHRPRDPPQSPDGGRVAVSRVAARRSREPPRGRRAHPRGRRRGGRSRPLPRADHARRAPSVAGAAPLPRRGARGRAASRGGGRERAQPVARNDLPALGQPRPEPAAVADIGPHETRRRAGVPVRAAGWRRCPPRRA